MNNELKCIICGNAVHDNYTAGKLKDMNVVFCEEHSDYCEKCSISNCEERGKCKFESMTS